MASNPKFEEIRPLCTAKYVQPPNATKGGNCKNTNVKLFNNWVQQPNDDNSMKKEVSTVPVKRFASRVFNRFQLP